ncbi:MAG: hypothetical protein JO359_08680 [Candidatus Eremiobacteraeota bacterium]|nr:hypothetical protein [Candidatus Eremiobacteraeota bacterium]
MPSITEVQEQIFRLEGFRVSFERFGAAKSTIPAYDYPVMAPNTWKISDWRAVRLARYIPFFKGVTVFRGDGEPQKGDVKLGHLRDGYYKAEYGTTEPEP